MAVEIPSVSGDPLADLRRRGQFLVAALLWAACGGLLLVAAGYGLLWNHYAVSLAERIRSGLGYSAPLHGPDWFLLAAIAFGPSLALLAFIAFLRWYHRLWLHRVGAVWVDRHQRQRHAQWQHAPFRADQAHRERHHSYLTALLASPVWSGRSCSKADVEGQSEWVLEELEKDIAERALATGLTVGLSRSRTIDLLTIFAAALEMQLHVLSSLGKRPSLHAWQLLIQRCGASLFLNSYLTRQDSLQLNLMIKKAGMGLQAGGDLMQNAAQHLSGSDFDLDEALNLPHSGVLGLATKGVEMGATMAFTVGQVGLHVLGSLVESVGDELTQGALAAGVLYYHGMALASDTLALDVAHRSRPAMNRSFREGVWKMGEIAGSILRDLVRQRRTAFRDRRTKIVRSLPRSAYARIQTLFSRKTPASA